MDHPQTRPLRKMWRRFTRNTVYHLTRDDRQILAFNRQHPGWTWKDDFFFQQHCHAYRHRKRCRAFWERLGAVLRFIFR